MEEIAPRTPAISEPSIALLFFPPPGTLTRPDCKDCSLVLVNVALKKVRGEGVQLVVASINRGPKAGNEINAGDTPALLLLYRYLAPQHPLVSYHPQANKPGHKCDCG